MIEEITTEEEAMEAVQEDYKNIINVPKEYLTEDVCIAAVQSNAWAIQYVPKELINEEICLEAASAWRDEDHVLKIFPKEYLTYDVCYADVQNEAIDIEDVPNELIDENMCLRAVEQGSQNSGQYLDCIPEKMKTKDVCLAALGNSDSSVLDEVCDEIPGQFWNDADFCASAVGAVSDIDIFDDYIKDTKIRHDVGLDGDDDE
jgi:hypothetical protein